MKDTIASLAAACVAATAITAGAGAGTAGAGSGLAGARPVRAVLTVVQVRQESGVQGQGSAALGRSGLRLVWRDPAHQVEAEAQVWHARGRGGLSRGRPWCSRLECS